MTCQYCENGQCPCGSGCTGCMGTMTCSECHGLGRTETLDVSVRHTERMAARGFVWCAACRRRTRQMTEPPDFEDIRDSNPRRYTKMMTLERCRRCHVPFQDVRNRPFGYKLRELTAA